MDQRAPQARRAPKRPSLPARLRAEVRRKADGAMSLAQLALAVAVVALLVAIAAVMVSR